MANQDLKENVLLNLRSVTQSCKGGVPFERLQKDYRDLLGSPIPYRELGYNSLEAFIRDIPDVISLRKNNEGQLVAEGVADASTAHIVSLVSRQKADTRKRNFRRSSYSGGMQRTLSSRYPFREGSRGSHSRYNVSPPQYSVKSSKSKPPKVAHVEKHSKPRSPPAQVPNRQYEVAPRFLKLQNGSRSASTFQNETGCVSYASNELTSSPTHNSSSSQLSDRAIPPPRPFFRSLPNKPQPAVNSHAAQLEALESARTAKEFISIYSKRNNITPEYRTILMGQKSKNKGFVSTLTVGKKNYRLYPDQKETAELAEEEVAKKAMADIKKSKENLSICPETPYGNEKEIRALLDRIEEIVWEKPSGMFQNGIVTEYANKFNETLPSCWLELLKQSCNVEIEELDVSYGRVPEGAKFIIHPVRELSSGNRTPSSTSSKTEYVYDDLDMKTLKKSLISISSPKIPEFIIPNGNIWELFITNVRGWFSARVFDYYDEFLALSKEMRFYYKNNSSEFEIFESQLYAAYLDENPDIWHRVLVEEIKEDDQISCYFVDEGDFMCLRKENLQEMNPNFLKLPFQAIQISLDGLTEYENCIKYELLEKHILGETLVAEVKRWHSIPEFFPEVSGIHRTVYSVVLYDTSDSSAEDLNLNEWLKKSVKESLMCKLPKLSTSTCAYLSHVTADGLVYLRLTNPQFCLIEQELEKLSPDFEEASLKTQRIPVNNSMCVAKYESGKWHRAVVAENLQASNDPEFVEVFFVDYGHPGVVGKNEICELEPISDLLASAPHQAICCELLNAFPSPNSKWTEAATAKLMELAPFDQELIVRVMNEGDKNNVAKVNLYKRNEDSNIISINDSLSCNPSFFKDEGASYPLKVPSDLPISKYTRKSSLKDTLSNDIPDVAVPAEQMAKRLGSVTSPEHIDWLNTPDNLKSPEAFELQYPTSLALPEIPDRGQLFSVFVTLAAHPHNFFVQPLISSSELDELMKKMQQFYSCEENLLEMDFSMLTKNSYYAALHVDNSWYRVRVINITKDNIVMVAVDYVDFGDYNIISINKLQPLYQQFKNLPCQAVNASLAGIKPFDTDWDPVHCVKFREMVTEKLFVSVVHKKHFQTKDDIPSIKVELILIDTNDPTKDVYIHERLIEMEIAKPE